MTDILKIPFLDSTVSEIAAVVFALLYLLLAIKRERACWIFAGISSILYLIVMAKAQLYMQTALQLFYLIMAIYGWSQWKNSLKQAHTDFMIQKWSLKNHCRALLVTLILTVINGKLLSTLTQVQAPYLDAFITWGSILTTWMVAHRILENWLHWFIIDLSAAYLYYTQSLTFTALLFVLYTLLVIYGYIDWKKHSKSLSDPTWAYE